MGWMAAQARSAKAYQIGQDWIFPPIRALQLVSVISVAMGAAFLFFGLRASGADRFIGISIGLSIISLSGITWPKAIRLSEYGLQQHSWYGGSKKIAWSEVSDVNERRDGSVVVRGKNARIVLSQFHSDRNLFLEKVHRLTALPQN
jgi:hypothetical protein